MAKKQATAKTPTAKNPTEAAITRDIKKYLTELKKSGLPIWFAKIHGGPMQVAGIPDLLVVYRGRLIALEIKRPGRNATPLQQHMMDAMRAAGAVAVVVSSVHDTYKVIWGKDE